MKKSLKKAFALLLALAVIFATFKTAPASSAEAKGSTKYSASKVYISPSYLSGYDKETIWKSVPKKRVQVYGASYVYVYSGDLAKITDVSVKGKGLVAYPSDYVGSSNGRKYGEIEFEAKKAGTYTVSFKIQKANGSKTKKYSFKVYASATTNPFKSVSYAGKTVSSSKGSMKKGDVCGVARIAGIMGAKKCSDLIPLCHPLFLTGVEVWFELCEEEAAVKAFCRTKTTGKTGVEMEALTGVQTALLTIYDMCKAVDRSMVISNVRLLEKSGGKSGDFHA